ncbi:MAG: C10 family peptidase [Muribaculaceae bacterium]|nr:C10 family peptidase [Muribaculaceae bacterium]
MRNLFFLLVMGLLTAGCNQSDAPTAPGSHGEGSADPLTKAIDFAESMMNDVQGEGTRSASRKIKSIECLTSNTRSAGAGLYVVNYGSDGFAIVSTSPEHLPVYAFSTESGMSLSDTVTNPGLRDYLKYLSESFNSSSGADGGAGSGLIPGPVNPPFPPLPPVQPAHGEVTIKPKLTSSVAKWHQGYPFNQFCLNQYPSGCAPTACGMLMTYYKAPTQYKGYFFDWEDMTVSHYAPGIPVLISCLGNSDNLKVQYLPDGSGADTRKYLPRTLENFGYVKPEFKPFGQLLPDLKNSPLLVRADEADSDIGHVWVIDGEYMYDYGDLADRPTPTTTLKKYYFHTVWGWGGKHNGYFYYGESVAHYPGYTEPGETAEEMPYTFINISGIGTLTVK